jgi:hypothetical protein
MTKKVISQRLIDILNKGYKYVPETERNQQRLEHEFSQIVSQIDSHAVKESLLVNSFISVKKTNKEIASQLFYSESKPSPKDEIYLKKYMIEHDLIIRNADKNLGFTVMDQLWYDAEMKKHLDNRKYYKAVNSFPQEDIYKKLYSILEKATWMSSGDKNSLLNKTRNHETQLTPKIYLVPKIHKRPISTRPVVPEHATMIQHVSKYLDKILVKLVKGCPWILRGTGDLLDILEKHTIELKNPVIMSADVVSLFTNIDVKHGIACIRQILRKEGKEPAFVNTIAELLDWTFSNNYFDYKGQLFLQIYGTAMGTSVAPNFANLVLMKIEEDKIFSAKMQLSHYCRLIDDCLMVVDGKDVNDWKQIFQDANNSLDFTFVTSENERSVPMLDLELYLGDKFYELNKVDFVGFQKPYNNNLFTAPDSSVPDNYKFSWITSENIRLIRNNDNEKSYLKQLEKYTDNLLKRSYPCSIILAHLKHKWDDRTALRTTKTRSMLNSRIIRIPNIAGYDQLIEATRMYIDLTVPIMSLPHFTPIVLRGKNLATYANSSNNKLLGK